MPVYHANMGPIVIQREDGTRRFVPEPDTRRILVVGASVGHNPVVRRLKNAQAARMIIGGNVGGEPTWNTLDIEEAFMRQWAVSVDRLKQEGLLGPEAGAGASVVAQRGVWQGGTPEISAQIVVINDLGIPKQRFEDEMIRIAEHLCEELQQREIYIDFQINGLSQELAVVEA